MGLEQDDEIDQLAAYYEAVVAASGAEPKLCANWVTTDLLGALNKLSKDIAESPISAEAFAALLKRIADTASEPSGTTPEETATILRSEYEQWGRIIRAKNIKLD